LRITPVDITDRLSIDLPAGYRPDWVLAYLGRDPLGLSETSHAGGFRKLVEIDGTPVALTVTFTPGRAEVVADPALTVAEAARARAILIRLLGLSHDPAPLEALADSDPLVARLVGDRRGLRAPNTATVFEGLCWAIVGQQVNLRFAATLRGTLIELAGRRHPAGGIAHPGPAAVLRLDPAVLLARKFSARKVEYLQDMARLAVEGRLDLEALPTLDPAEAEERLTGLRGIGPWTRAYLMLRSCGFPDVAPFGDVGLAAALHRFYDLPARPTPAEQERLMQPFRPWRSHATALLWGAV